MPEKQPEKEIIRVREPLPSRESSLMVIAEELHNLNSMLYQILKQNTKPVKPSKAS